MAQSNLPPQNLDELVNVTITPGQTLDDAFTGYDAFNGEVHQNHVYNNILVPAQNRLHDVIVGKLTSLLGAASDDFKIHGKKEEVQKAVATGIKEYFALTQPSQVRGLASLHLSDEEEYEFLARLFDKHMGVGRYNGVESIRRFEEMARSDETATIGKVKRELHGQQRAYIQIAMMGASSDYIQRRFAGFTSLEVLAYIQPKLTSDAAKKEFDKQKIGYSFGSVEQIVYFRDEYLLQKTRR